MLQNPTTTTTTSYKTREEAARVCGAIVGEGGLISADLIVIALIVSAFNAVLAPIAAPIMAWALAAEVERR